MSSSDTGDADDVVEGPTLTDEEFDHELRGARALIDPKDPPDAFFLAVRDGDGMDTRQAIQVDEPSAADIKIIFDLLGAHIRATGRSIHMRYSKVAALGLKVARNLGKYEYEREV